MKYNQVGTTEYSISEIGFGAEWMGERTDSEVKAIVKLCEDNGVNFLDCWMSDPSIRSKLGDAISDSRDKWIIQGHIGSTWQDNQYVRTRDMSKVIPAFEDLLTRLRTDYIEFGMIHYVDEVKEYEDIINGEFMEYVYKLKDDGVIKHIGISTHNPDVALLSAEHKDIELIMFSLNPAFDMMPPVKLDYYFDKDKYNENLGGIIPIRKRLYDLCRETDTALTVMKGFAGGRLFKDDESPFGVSMTPVQCIHYALTRDNVKSILVGIKDENELLGCLDYENASVEDKDFTSILSNAPSHSYLGHCIYCGHCAPCVNGINIASVNKFYDLAIEHDDIPESIREHYNNLGNYASSCIECGDCMTRCPFDVDIIDYMNKASQLFGK